MSFCSEQLHLVIYNTLIWRCTVRHKQTNKTNMSNPIHFSCSIGARAPGKEMNVVLQQSCHGNSECDLQKMILTSSLLRTSKKCQQFTTLAMSIAIASAEKMLVWLGNFMAQLLVVDVIPQPASSSLTAKLHVPDDIGRCHKT